jgi:hypothetical protein
MKYRILAAVALTAMLVGCKTGPDKRITNLSGEQALFHSDKKGESLETKLLWVKNKPKAIDIDLQFTNNYKKPVLLKIRNFEGEVAGTKTTIVMPDDYVRLAPEQSWNGIISLRFAAPNKHRIGPGKLSIPVHEAGVDNVEGKALKTAIIDFPMNPVE